MKNNINIRFDMKKLAKILMTTLLLSLPSLTMAHATPHYHQDEIYPPWLGTEGIGSLTFITSTQSPEAQKWFELGMKLMYNYEFPSSTYAFRKAQEIDPGFAMAYWGEALSQFKLVWSASNPAEARRILVRLHQQTEVDKLSIKEQMLIKALEAASDQSLESLSPQSSRSGIWQLRSNMHNILIYFPNDPEIKVLYAYSILGTRKGIFDFQANATAGALLKSVLKENPTHPGALHFTLHAYENSIQAPCAKFAAERYAQVSYGAIHSLHMPSHYYYAIGDWQKVIEINIHAWEESKRLAKDLGLNSDSYEYHGYYWIPYAYLQLGNTQKAFEYLRTLYALQEANPSSTKLTYLARARANFLSEVPVQNILWKRVFEQSIPKIETASFEAYFGNLFAEAYGAYQEKKLDSFMVRFNRFEAALPTNQSSWDSNPSAQSAVIIMHAQLQAMKEETQGNIQEALILYRQAVKLEEQLPQEHGVPILMKPSEELLGSLLAQLERNSEAQYYYQRVLLHYHQRRYSMLQLNELKYSNIKAEYSLEDTEPHSFEKSEWYTTQQLLYTLKPKT